MLLTVFLAAGVSCGESLSPAERILLERQKFSIVLVSWAPVMGDQLALDLELDVRGQSRLDQLTVEVRQVGADDQVLRVDALSLDVAGMKFDGRRTFTRNVPSAGEGVRAVGVVLENAPEDSKRATYPEFAGA